jgi:hypothetical protein
MIITKPIINWVPEKGYGLIKLPVGGKNTTVIIHGKNLHPPPTPKINLTKKVISFDDESIKLVDRFKKCPTTGKKVPIKVYELMAAQLVA